MHALLSQSYILLHYSPDLVQPSLPQHALTACNPKLMMKGSPTEVETHSGEESVQLTHLPLFFLSYILIKQQLYCFHSIQLSENALNIVGGNQYRYMIKLYDKCYFQEVSWAKTAGPKWFFIRIRNTQQSFSKGKYTSW